MKHRSGFTLVEVLVALGIAGGALVLLMSANRESMRRSVNSRKEIQIEQSAQSKLDEIRLNLEQNRSGSWVEFPEHRWDCAEEQESVEGIKYLVRLTFRLRGADGRVLRTYQSVVYRPEAAK